MYTPDEAAIVPVYSYSTGWCIPTPILLPEMVRNKLLRQVILDCFI